MSDRTRRWLLVRLAWRNVRRQSRRTALTVSAVAVAVAAIIVGLSFLTGVLANMLDTYARTQTGHVRVRDARYAAREAFMPMHLSLAGIGALLPAIRAAPGVEAALPRLRASVLVDGAESNRPGQLLGLDLPAEAPYLDPAALTASGRVPEMGRPEVLVGDELAARLAVGIGDTLTLLGQTAHRSLGGIRLEVVGLAHSGVPYLDHSLLLAPLDQAQQLAALDDAATEIVVYAADPDRARELAAILETRLGTLAAGIEVKSWEDQGTIVGMLGVAKLAWGALIGLMLLMAALVIVNTMMMNVLERTREIGMQMALGMRPGDVMRLVIAEGLAIGVVGGLLGALVGTAGALVLSRVGVDFSQAARTVSIPFQGVIRAEWALGPTLLNAAAGVIAAGLAAVYPGWLAVRLRPAEALRR
jgi:putative ABC transport system permease protein